MQSKATLRLKSFPLKFVIITLIMFSFFGKTSSAQTTITATQTLTTVASIVTINFTNNNATPVVITRIDGILNNAPGILVDVTGFFKTGPVAGPPGQITAANNWIQFASRTVTSTGANSNIQLLSSALTIPAGATYGIAINGVRSTDATVPGRIVFNNGTGTFTPTFTAGGCVLTTGPNVSFNTFTPTSPQSPTGGPTYFVGAITFVPGVVCTGTPSAGNTLSNSPSSCPGVPFTLSSSVAQPVSTTGLTYQLQSSPTLGGTFTNVGVSSLFPTFNVTQTTSTAYRILITCTNGGGSSSSVPIFIPANAICYCNAGATSTAFEKIANVTFANINRSSTSTAGYENFTTDTAQLISSGTYPITVTGNASVYSGDIVKVWIDFNQNGSFTDPGESVFTSTPSAGPFRGLITIPSTALLGFTRMRVRLYDGTFGTLNATPCGNSTYGQVEDYTVNINPCFAIAFTSQPANATTVCGGNTSFSVGITGSLPVYQWQFRINSTSPWLVVPNTPPYSGANTATLILTNASSSLDGYQYRVVVSGACTGADFSSSVTLTVTPFIPAITPATAVLCAGSSLQLFASPPPSTTTVTSASNLNIAIPDGVAAGINNAITMANIPAGAVVTNISVKVNIPHTYVADLMLVIKAPNGRILNLSNLLGGQNNPGENFTNTNFSGATGLPALGTGTSPGYTGTFRPDAAGPVGAFGLPSGPTGFIPNVTTFNGLGQGGPGSAVNGSWTIAMYDAGPPDVGTLKDWSVSITWGVTPATAVFSPNTNLFLDAALTIPYNGTAVNSVFTNTAVSTTYTAVVSTGTCSATATIPVTVNTAAGGSPTLSNTSVCVGSNTFIKLGGTLTGGPGFVHNFQVKVPGATSFTNITAGGVYSFNRDTLKLTAVPLSFNGYQFRDSISTGANCGSVISTVATLSVNPIPVVTISAAPRRNLFPGLTTTLTAAVSSATGTITYQWFRNGVAVPGATNNTLVVGIDGVGLYTVKATAQGCTSADSTTTPQSITIGDSSGVTKLFIYPSPNNGKFQVRYFSDINNGTKNPAMLNVYDEKGTRVFSKFYGLSSGYQQMNVDLGGHASGIYRVELLDLNGDRIKTGSVMVF